MRSGLPKDRLLALEAWVEDIANAHTAGARPVKDLGLNGISKCFTPMVLHTTKVVLLPRFPAPPFIRLGLPEPRCSGSRLTSILVLPDRYFLLESQAGDEALHFVALVRAVQRLHLGAEDYLTGCMFELLHGPETNPLEAPALSLQARFKGGEVFDAFAAACAEAEKVRGALWGRVNLY